MQTFSIGTTIYTGVNALQALRTICGGRVLIVTDRFFSENGKAQELASLCGGECRIFDRVQPDPPLSLIAEGIGVLKEFRPDSIVALGGGSPIDCAKGILSLGASDARLIAIPTTSGTGSEVTSFSILTHEGVKHPLIDEKLRPAAAILDPSLLDALPPKLIADSGMDVISHCLEAIAAKNASPFSDALAMCAFDTARKLLPKSFAGDTSVRQALHNAATMAGLAFDNAGLGACHALSHAIGGKFHLAHGRINGILLPHVIQFNAEACPEPYRHLAAFCGLSGIRALSAAIVRLRSALQLPESLTQAGLQSAEILAAAEELCQAAQDDPCSQGNPRPMTAADYHALLRQCL